MAEFLLNLNENDYEYNTYLAHKSFEPVVTNHALLNELSTRKYGTKTLIEDFECFVCSKKVVEQFKKGFECGEQLVFPPLEENHITDINWQSFVIQGKCEADTLNYFVSKNVLYSDKDYSNELMRRYDHGICKT